MAAREVIVPGAMPSRDQNGRALPAKLRFYMPSTTTPAIVYSSMNLDTPLAFPIISDSAGRWPQIWAEEETYFDVTWSDLATDALIAGYADVRPLDDGVLASATQAEAAADAAQAAADAAAATAIEIAATIAELGDFSDAVTDAEAAAVAATAQAAAASASAAAAAASASSIDTDEILRRARGFAICAATVL